MARNIDSRISIVNLNDLIPQQIYSTTICIIAVISLIGLLSSFIDNSFILVAAPLVSIFMLDSQQILTISEFNYIMLDNCQCILLASFILIFMRLCISFILKD